MLDKYGEPLTGEALAKVDELLELYNNGDPNIVLVSRGPSNKTPFVEMPGKQYLYFTAASDKKRITDGSNLEENLAKGLNTLLEFYVDETVPEVDQNKKVLGLDQSLRSDGRPRPSA